MPSCGRGPPFRASILNSGGGCKSPRKINWQSSVPDDRRRKSSATRWRISPRPQPPAPATAAPKRGFTCGPPEAWFGRLPGLDGEDVAGIDAEVSGCEGRQKPHRIAKGRVILEVVLDPPLKPAHGEVVTFPGQTAAANHGSGAADLVEQRAEGWRRAVVLVAVKQVDQGMEIVKVTPRTSTTSKRRLKRTSQPS